LYLPAVATTLLILFVLIYFVRFEQRFTGRREYKGLVLVVEDRPGQVGVIGSLLGEMNVLIKNIQLNRLEGNDLEIELLLQTPPNTSIEQVMERLEELKDIRSLYRLN